MPNTTNTFPMAKDNCSSFEPTCIQAIRTPRGTANHTYRDFSKMPATAAYQRPVAIKDMSFSEKLHSILSNPEYERWISWMPHGRAFKVHVPVSFENGILPTYFGHKRYSSFLRDLNNYGFKHLTRGVDRNCYYHEFMLQDRPHLCQYMPKRKEARRQVPDPTNEPNFYAIADRFPLDAIVPDETLSAAELKAPEATNVTEDKPQTHASFHPMTHVQSPTITGQPNTSPARAPLPVASAQGASSQASSSSSPMSVEALLVEILVSNNEAQTRVPPAPTTPATDLATLVNAIHQVQQTQLQDAVTSLAAQLARDKKRQEMTTSLALALSLLGK